MQTLYGVHTHWHYLAFWPYKQPSSILCGSLKMSRASNIATYKTHSDSEICTWFCLCFWLELPNHNSLLGFFAKLWVVCDLIVFCTFCQAKCWPLVLAFFIRAVRKLILIDWLNYWKCVFKPTRPKRSFFFVRSLSKRKTRSKYELPMTYLLWRRLTNNSGECLSIRYIFQIDMMHHAICISSGCQTNSFAGSFCKTNVGTIKLHASS